VDNQLTWVKLQRTQTSLDLTVAPHDGGHGQQFAYNAWRTKLFLHVSFGVVIPTCKFWCSNTDLDFLIK
jgi:hypothetical protein